MLLQALLLGPIRSVRQLMDRLEFDLLFRWFVGIGVDDGAWDVSTFSKNRERLLEGDIAAKLLSAVLPLPRVKQLLSTDHFLVDGTLIEAWASMKSSAEGWRRTAGRCGRPQRGGGFPRREAIERYARLDHRPGSEALPQGAGQGGQALLHGACADGEPQRPLVDACSTWADGHAERIAALHMIEPRADRPQAITLGFDKAYDAEDFVNELRSMNATPHVAQNTSGRSSAIDGRTRAHAGYAVSQRIRNRIEEAFGWMKTIGGQEKTLLPRTRSRSPGPSPSRLHSGGLQPGAAAQTAGDAGMSRAGADELQTYRPLADRWGPIFWDSRLVSTSAGRR